MFEDRPILEMDSTGDLVKRAQALINEGWHLGLATDGDFGKHTHDAVRKVQGKTGLKQDGVIGPNTWTKLELQTVELGSKGPAVGGCQNALNANWGYHLAVDEDFGDLTDHAVRDMQTRASIESDGVVGPITWGHLMQKAPQPTPRPTPQPVSQTLNIIDPRLSFNGPLTKRGTTNYIIYHHAEAESCTIQDVDQWHKERGWLGCGYNFFVRKDGSIYKGRGMDTIGAHCLNHNFESVGICAEGNYMVDSMPDVQKQSLIALGRYVRSLYPQARPVGHRELNSTDCPGNNYPLAEIKAAVMAIQSA